MVFSNHWGAAPRVVLPPTGLDSNMTDTELAVQDTVRKFATNVMRPIGAELDRMSPEEVIAAQSPLWNVFQEYAELGFTVSFMAEMPPEEQARLVPIVFEELAWGDAGLAVSLAASSLPAMVVHHLGNEFLIQRFPETMIGCWGITEPDHGSDMLDFNQQNSQPGTSYGRPNCLVRISDDELIISGQKSAWVSNGGIAQVCVLYAAADRGEGPREGCVVMLPLDAPGVSRGKPLDKLGQRALNQSELFFDEVRLPLEYLAVPPEGYQAATYYKLATANAYMGALFTGVARAAYEHALQYAHERKQGGAPIIRHQLVKHRLFHMFRKVEASRALTRRVMAYNFTQPVPALQGSIAAKLTATQTAFEVASDALGTFGGNGLTREYPLEKLLRDARASMIEDGCNEILALKGGSCLMDPDLL